VPDFLDAPWNALAPGIAISLTVLSYNLFGDARQDVLDRALAASATEADARAFGNAAPTWPQAC
jgi:hypothetical protein